MIQKMFDDFYGIYNYAPSIMQDGNKRYIYYCANLNPEIIIDYIALREGYRQNNSWEYGEKAIVLNPNTNISGSWDNVHACDPSVVKGKFSLKGEEYSYMLAYLGCNTLDCTINQVGLAFSKTPYGPFIKYDKNPIVSFSLKKEGRWWGVGQPSIINLDKKSSIRLLYTRGDKKGTRICFVDIDASDINNLIVTAEKEVSSCGLISAIGRQDEFANADFAFDSSKKMYYAVRDRRPITDKMFPSFIMRESQICSAKAELFDGDKSQSWVGVDSIIKEKTGYDFNHNCGIVRDMFGHVVSSDKLEVIFTSAIQSTSNEDLRYLWNYRLHSITINI